MSIYTLIDGTSVRHSRWTCEPEIVRAWQHAFPAG